MTQPLTIEAMKKRIVELEMQVSRQTFSEQLTRTLFHVSDAANTFTDPDKLYPFIYRALDQIMGLPNFYVAVIDKHSSFVKIPFCIHEHNKISTPETALFDDGTLIQEILKNNRPLVLNQTQLNERITDKQAAPIPQIWMGVPITREKHLFGAIAIFNHNDPAAFDQKDMDILITVSHQIALAIERKHAFDELAMVKNYLCNIINSMPSILLGVDKHCRITQWNLQAELETGIKSEDAANKNLFDVFPRLADISEQIRESIYSGKVRTRLKQKFHTGQEKRYEDIVIYPLTFNGTRGGVIRIDDITEQVRMEEMVIQSERMMSIGGFAASMAHELNNPISGMMQNAQIAYNRIWEDLPANDSAAREVGITMEDIRAYMEKRNLPETLANIRETGSRASKIIKNVLSFARKSDPVLAPQDLASILKEAIALVKNDSSLNERYRFNQIDMIQAFDPIPKVPCDSDKMHQVFFNIIKNGLQAMSDNPESNRSPRFIFRIYQQGPMACIEIEDNGPGINEETQKRLFEPYYTTKSAEEGTGLGLSISYFIVVTGHHGQMTVESVLNDHTRFTIKLPC